jgi:hypothetical protein
MLVPKEWKKQNRTKRTGVEARKGRSKCDWPRIGPGPGETSATTRPNLTKDFGAIFGRCNSRTHMKLTANEIARM